MKFINEIQPIHLFLAYMGMLIHIFMKLAELQKSKDFNIISYTKKNMFSMIASVIMIPVLLIVAKDSSLSELLPINNLTAVLAGWQTQSLFKTLMQIASKKVSQ